MKANNWQRSNPVPIRAYIAVLTDTDIHLKVVRLASRAILAGLIGVGSIDYVPTILAISRIIVVYIDALIAAVHCLFTTNDLTFAEIFTLIGNVNNQSTAAVECYLQIVSRD